MRTEKINIYKFSELSEDAKQNAIEKWYETEDYPFLSDDLTDRCRELLRENECEADNINVLYSLGYSQGDGLCFTGQISKGGYTLNLSHNYRYYFAKSVAMELLDSDGEEIDMPENCELTAIYFKVCRELEKEGYSILEYRMNNDEFAELCEANDYEFYENGKIA